MDVCTRRRRRRRRAATILSGFKSFFYLVRLFTILNTGTNDERSMTSDLLYFYVRG